MSEDDNNTPLPGKKRRPALRFFLLAACLALAAGGGLLFGRVPDRGSGPVADSLTSPAADQKVVAGPVSLSLGGDRRALLQGDDGRVHLELLLKAEVFAEAASARQPTDFIVVLDRSGSMGSEDKMQHAREAVIGLIDRLGPDDRFALVIYDDRVELKIPLALASSEARERFKRAVASIDPAGTTNLSAGLDQGLGVLRDRRLARMTSLPGAARMVLISDGLANQGDVSRAGLVRRAQESSAQTVPLTAIGVGTDFDENLMGAIADAGAGNFYYLRDAVALAQVFEGELGATRETVAEAVEIEIVTPPGVQVVSAAGYPLEVSGGKAIFRPGSLFAGQERRVWLTLEVAGDRLGRQELGQVVARYQRQGARYELAALEAPAVERVGDEATFLAFLDKKRVSRLVAEEEYGELQQKVAQHVRAGRKDAAKSEIAAYAAKSSRLNATLQSSEVASSLEAAGKLEKEVDSSFEGVGQDLKQNTLSKSNMASGLDKRRAGAKKMPTPKSGGGN